MNPKLTITVDGMNRAMAVMEGVVSVSAKVDVVLKGLTSDIPLWGDDDGFVGYSLRFRIVDECGHDLVRYPLEETDSWNSTSTGVYESVTAVDFDTDALRHIFEGVVFNDALEFGVILDSVVDAAEYGTGRLKIQQWAVASTEDPTVLPDWRETLAKLQEGLENIETAQSATEMARDEAASAASSAAASAAVSASCATAAGTAQNSARASELNAAKSEAEAGKAADAAEAACDGAEMAEASAISAAASATGSAAAAAESAKEAAESAIAAGKVKSVNGKTGEVVLEASDVGAYTKVETNAKLSSKADLVDGVVPASQLPSYVDDVLEYASLSVFPSTGESGKIYVATDTNLTYRWGGSQYVEVSQSLALGETASTAYAGDKGKAVTDALATHKDDTSNPHAVTAEQVGALPVVIDPEEPIDGNYYFDGSLRVEYIHAKNVAMFDRGCEICIENGAYFLPGPDGTFLFKNYDGDKVTKLTPDGSDVATKEYVKTASLPVECEEDNKYLTQAFLTFNGSEGGLSLYRGTRLLIGYNSRIVFSDGGDNDALFYFESADKTGDTATALVHFTDFDSKNDSTLTPDGSAVVTENTLKTKAPVTSVNGSTGAVMLTANDVGAVPTTRTVNGKLLSADVIISAEDVNAYAKEYVYTKTEIAEQMSTKASLSDIYSKQELEQLFVLKTTADDTYAAKSALDALAATVGEANDLLESVA